jgi:hypothetical protein
LTIDPSGDYSYPTAITVDEYGRVRGVTGGPIVNSITANQLLFTSGSTAGSGISYYTDFIYDSVTHNLAIGGATGQAGYSIAIGYQAGVLDQSGNAIAIGSYAGSTGQRDNTVAIGTQAGAIDQSSNAVAIGPMAGWSGQSPSAIAIGLMAGLSGQNQYAVAIGSDAGLNTQGSAAVAIGLVAGQSLQGANAVAIGNSAGQTGQASNAIAIGAYAGITQSAASIILNAGGLSGATADNGITGFFVNPVRTVDISANASGYYPVSYKSSTNEIVYHPVTTFKGYVAGGFECNTASTTVTSTAAGVTFTSVKRPVGGITLGSSATRITLPVVGLYEITSILQCGLGSVPNPTVISAWHSLNGLTGTAGQMETGVRSLYVTDSSGSILTTSMVLQTSSTSDYAQLNVVATANASLLTTGTTFGNAQSTCPAVFTTVKLIG